MKKGLIIFIVCAVVGGVIGYTSLSLLEPTGNPQVRQVLDIPEGVSFSEVAQTLHDHNLIRSTGAFLWLGRLTGAERKIIPGEYEFRGGMKPSDILAKIVNGEVVQYVVTIPEGFSVVQVADLLHQKGLADREEFLRVVQDPEVIRGLNLQVSHLEGYLFPDTYHFHRNLKTETIVRTMVDRLRQALTPRLLSRAAELGLSVHEVLTLASVVEKETGQPEERGLISGVFHNRLKRKIPLQSDPTVIYALKVFDGNLRKKDLGIDSPYNTYRVRGLPPGPIANPGAEAIDAALYPVRTHFLYFVARNDGSHKFSATLREHNQAVRKYQLSRARRSS